MNFTIQIEKARKLFERAEKDNNPQEKILALNKAMVLLYECSSNAQSQTDIDLISNIKRAHTRSLLSQIGSLQGVDIESWLDYLILISTKLNTEMESITKSDNHLRENWEHFISQYKTELRDVLAQNVQLLQRTQDK